MIGLTKKQRRIYDFIAAEIAAKGVAPTLREIAKECAVSIPRVFTILKTLEERGAIRRGTAARQIELTQSAVTLNAEILTLTDRYAAQEGVSRDTAANQILREWLATYFRSAA